MKVCVCVRMWYITSACEVYSSLGGAMSYTTDVFMKFIFKSHLNLCVYVCVSIIKIISLISAGGL